MPSNDQAAALVGRETYRKSMHAAAKEFLNTEFGKLCTIKRDDIVAEMSLVSSFLMVGAET